MGVVKVGIVGLGSMGRRHLDTLLRTEGAQVTAVATRSEEKRAEVVDKLGISVVADYRQLIGLVDAVVIAVPTVLHAEMGNFFLQQGVHVLLEKPIAATVNEARSLVQTAQTSGALFMVGHIERFNPAYRRLQQVIQETGEPSGRIKVQGYRMGPFDGRAQDVGIELDLMIHDVDAVAGLFPQYRVRLQNALGMAVVSSLPDTAITRLSFEYEGKECGNAQLLASRIADNRRRCCSVEYAGFSAELDFMNQSLRVAKNGGEWQGIPVAKAFPLDGELAHFISCVRTGTKPAVDGEAALRALEICTQASELMARARE